MSLKSYAETLTEEYDRDIEVTLYRPKKSNPVHETDLGVERGTINHAAKEKDLEGILEKGLLTEYLGENTAGKEHLTGSNPLNICMRPFQDTEDSTWVGDMYDNGRDYILVFDRELNRDIVPEEHEHQLLDSVPEEVQKKKHYDDTVHIKTPYCIAVSRRVREGKADKRLLDIYHTLSENYSIDWGIRAVRWRPREENLDEPWNVGDRGEIDDVGYMNSWDIPPRYIKEIRIDERQERAFQKLEDKYNVEEGLSPTEDELKRILHENEDKILDLEISMDLEGGPGFYTGETAFRKYLKSLGDSRPGRKISSKEPSAAWGTEVLSADPSIVDVYKFIAHPDESDVCSDGFVQSI